MIEVNDVSRLMMYYCGTQFSGFRHNKKQHNNHSNMRTIDGDEDDDETTFVK